MFVCCFNSSANSGAFYSKAFSSTLTSSWVIDAVMSSGLLVCDAPHVITEHQCLMGDLVIRRLPELANVRLKNTLCQCVFMRKLIIYSRVCNHFHQLTSRVVFSTWQCIIQWPAPFRTHTAHDGVHVRVCESARETRHFAGTSRSCWQERGTITPHQHVINPQAGCLSHVAGVNADTALMSQI